MYEFLVTGTNRIDNQLNPGSETNRIFGRSCFSPLRNSGKHIVYTTTSTNTVAQLFSIDVSLTICSELLLSLGIVPQPISRRYRVYV